MKKYLLSLFSLFLITCALYAQTTQLTLSVTVTNATACIPPCNGSATANVSGGTSPYTYLWNIPLAPQMTQTATGLCPGTYQLAVFDSSVPLPNQGQQMVTISCNSSTAVTEVSASISLHVFPNPANGYITVKSNTALTGRSAIIIRNILGEVVQTQEAETNGYFSGLLDVSHLPAGVYSIEFVNRKEAIRSKFMKE